MPPHGGAERPCSYDVGCWYFWDESGLIETDSRSIVRQLRKEGTSQFFNLESTKIIHSFVTMISLGHETWFDIFLQEFVTCAAVYKMVGRVARGRGRRTHCSRSQRTYEKPSSLIVTIIESAHYSIWE